MRHLVCSVQRTVAPHPGGLGSLKLAVLRLARTNSPPCSRTQLKLQGRPRRARTDTVAHAEGNPNIPAVASGAQRRRVSKPDHVYWGSDSARDHKLEVLILLNSMVSQGAGQEQHGSARPRVTHILAVVSGAQRWRVSKVGHVYQGVHVVTNLNSTVSQSAGR